METEEFFREERRNINSYLCNVAKSFLPDTKDFENCPDETKSCRFPLNQFNTKAVLWNTQTHKSGLFKNLRFVTMDTKNSDWLRITYLKTWTHLIISSNTLQLSKNPFLPAGKKFPSKNYTVPVLILPDGFRTK